MNSDISDIEIITAVLRGEKESYGELVNRHKDFVFTIAYRILNEREDAEEVAQEAFIKAYQALSSFKKESLFSTWLYRIVFNTAISYKKRRKETHPIEIVKHEIYKSEYQSVLEMEDKRKYIQEAIKRLVPLDAAVITLFYLKEMSLEDVALTTGLNISNVKVRLHRARKRLATEMKNILKGEELTL